jgi:plasmid stabilization system protein ParE
VKYSVHPEAERELTEAAAFYHQTVNLRFASKFLDEFERVAQLLTENPGFGTPFDLPQRIYPFRVFPYSTIYKPTDYGVRILVVRHQNRAPSYGQGRN